MDIVICRLCRAKKVEESSVVSLKSVDESKLQLWACQNVGNRIYLDDRAVVCWSCVHSARKLSRCFGSAGLDWWMGLEDPNGNPEDEDEDSEDEGEQVHCGQQEKSTIELRPCFVQLSRLSVKQLNQSTECSVSVKLERVSTAQNNEAKSTPLSFICTLCSKSYPLRIQLKRHLRLIHRSELQRCKFCSCKFESREFLQIHCNYYHREDMEVAQLKLTCNYCNERMGSYLKLRQHITLHHPNLRFQCGDCSLWFSTLLSQRLHVRQMHTK